jgi:AAHS family 4-hydroxybenzoate transporter-like MFS transporter
MQAIKVMPTNETLRVVDVQEFIDSQPLSMLQKLLLLLCFFVVAIDGFDTAIIGFIAPAIRVEWGLEVGRLGPLFGAGLLGLMVGAFAVGPLADRHGRKTILIVSMVLFGGASLAAALSTSLASLICLRFLTGLGLGGAMPMTITISSEYVPGPRRSSLLTLMFCGFTIGSAMGGIMAARILPGYGWRALLVVGGAAPLLLTPLLAAVLPESVRYLVMKGNAQERIARVLVRIAPTADLRLAKFVDATASNVSPVRELFCSGLFLGTLLLWLAFFMSLLVVYLLTNWMPTLIQQASGASLADAAWMAAMFQAGGTLGAVVVGRLMDKYEPHGVLCSIYLAGSVCVILISLSAKAPGFMMCSVFAAGLCVSGGQVGANALSAAFYRTPYRATGVSWANGVGRLGSVVGSLLGGVLLGFGWSPTTVYALVAIPTAISALALAMLGIVRRRNQGALC